MFSRKVLHAFAGLAIAVSIAGCGGGSSPATVSGIASQGAVFGRGTSISLKDARGIVASTTVADDKGTYSVAVAGLTAPFIIKAGTLYSFAEAAGTVNVNPFTNVAVLNSAGADPATVYALTDTTQLATKLQAIKANIKTEVDALKTKLDSIYPDDSTIQKDFLNGQVVSLEKSYDKLFDSISISADSTTGQVTMTQTGQATPFMTATRSNGQVTYTVNTAQVATLANAMTGSFTVTVTSGGNSTTATGTVTQATTCKAGYAGATVSFTVPGVSCSTITFCASSTNPTGSGYYLIKGHEIELDYTKASAGDTSYLYNLALQMNNACI